MSKEISLKIKLSIQSYHMIRYTLGVTSDVAIIWRNQPRLYHYCHFDMLAGAYSGFDSGLIPRCFSCRTLFIAQIY